MADVGSAEVESGVISVRVCFLRTELLQRSFEGAHSLEGVCVCCSRTGEREIRPDDGATISARSTCASVSGDEGASERRDEQLCRDGSEVTLRLKLLLKLRVLLLPLQLKLLLLLLAGIPPKVLCAGDFASSLFRTGDVWSGQGLLLLAQLGAWPREAALHARHLAQLSPLLGILGATMAEPAASPHS